MKVLVRLFNCYQTATDGSRVPREVVEKYLNSSKYRETVEKGLINGGITHENRVLPEGSGLRNVIGRDDNMLRCSNITHIIDSVYLDGDDVMAVIRFLDESVVDKETAEKVTKLKGLVSNGVFLPGSMVLSCYWDQNEVAEEIVNLKGYDFTLKRLILSVL